jgi:hypothetical protein
MRLQFEFASSRADIVGDHFASHDFVRIEAGMSVAAGRSIADTLTARYIVIDEFDDDDIDEYYVLDRQDLDFADHIQRTFREYVRDSNVPTANIIELDRESLLPHIIVGDGVTSLFEGRGVVRVGGVLDRIVVPEINPEFAAEFPSAVAITPDFADAALEGPGGVENEGAFGAEVSGSDGTNGGGSNGGGSGRGGSRGGGAGGGGGGAGASRAAGLKVELPTQVVLGEEVELLARIVDELTGATTLPLQVRTGEEIAIVVQPRRGFEVIDSNSAKLTVQDELTTGLPVRVSLRATELGPASILVYAFRGQVAIGSITLNVEVVKTRSENRTSVTDLPVPGHSGAIPADLSLVIVRDAVATKPTLTFILMSKDLTINLRNFGPHQIDIDPVEYFTAAFDDIEANVGNGNFSATNRIRDLGAKLFEKAFPQDLQQLLWGLKERLETIVVQTTDPWVPWELCLLSGTDANGVIQEDGYFCEKFQLTRWIPQVPLHGTLTASSIGFIAPRDSALPSQEAEVAMLEGLSTDTRHVERIPATTEKVLEALTAARYDVIHFSGHGTPNRPTMASPSRLQLSGDNDISPDSITGRVRNLGRRQPLVFLNACRLGRQSMDLHGLGGWASAMLDSGAAGFVGTHWNVTDDLAAEFAKTFYGELLAGATVGAAAQNARTAIRRTDDPTWLAYAVYALPSAVVTASGSSSATTT